MLLLSLAAFASLALPASPAISAPQAADAPTRSEIEGAIDGALRWVRSCQDVETGSYGGLRETIGALEALTTSPRRYRPSDGPFVAGALSFVLTQQGADGAFDTGASTAASTQSMTRVLASFDGYESALQKARSHSAASATMDAVKSISPARGGELLARRNADGAWNAPEPSEDASAFLQTTNNVIELNRLAATLNAAERAEAATGNDPSGAQTEALPAFGPGDRARAMKSLLRGSTFLLSQAVEPGKWGFGGQADPGITAMVTDALLAAPGERPVDVQQAIDLALDWLVSMQKEDGSIHAGQLANYVTSASIMALVHGARPQDAPVVERARGFLQALQADEGEGYAPSDKYYGGVGYGGDERPDLSNMQMALEALSTAGVEHGDPTFQKALTFLERCQNRSESNTLEVVEGDTTTVSGNDGGAGYAPGDSKAGFIELRDGKRVPRSYGSMTYALLKGYLFAGLERDDPRVEAAWKWLSKNYTLDVNPGFEASTDPAAAYQGLFYYFITMTKALDLYGQEVIVDANGGEHAWRGEILGRIASMQRQDGSWINTNAPRWYEGNPVLATAYALVCLGTALPSK